MRREDGKKKMDCVRNDMSRKSRTSVVVKVEPTPYYWSKMITVACLTLHQYSYDLTDLPTLMLCSGTYIGYVVILSGEIVGEMLLAPLDLVQDMFFGIIGVSLFSVNGGLVLSSRLHGGSLPKTGDHNAALVVGSLAALNALIMLFDLTLAYLYSDEYDDEPSI